MASLTLDWLHVIVLLGAVQGLFLTGALAAKRSNRTANRILAACMLAFSVYLATSVYHAVGFEQVAPHFFGLAYPLPFLFGPLVYLYAVAAADRDYRFAWRDAMHFGPFVATVLAGLPIYLMSGAEKIEFYHRLLAGDRPLLLVIADPLKLVSGVIYVTITILFLRRHREQVKDSYSSTERVNLRWLLWLGGGAAGVWLVPIGLEVMDATGIAHFARGDEFVSLAIAALVYGIGYMGLRQPEIFRYETAEYRVPVMKAMQAAAPAAETARLAEAAPVPGGQAAPVALPELVPVVESDAAPRYERSGLTDREASRLKQALADVMDREQPWKDSDLTLADLAVRLNTTPHKLSEVLNLEVGQTFYDFVNGYRVREVQRRIAAGEARVRKMLVLAFDAGFASKSTFNEVFKRHTSQTPSDFRQAAGA